MAATFTIAGFGRGFKLGMALAFPISLYGVAFGVVAAQAGLGWAWALGWSAGVYSGSAQLAAMSVLQAGHVTLWSLALTILVINARYVLFGAAIQPWLSQAGPWKALFSVMLIGDSNWIATMRAIEAGEEDRAYLAGSGTPLVLAWLCGTLIGVVFGSNLPDPRALGADLMLPAFAAAMMAVMIKGKASLVPVALGGTAALIAGRFAGPGWGIIAAGVAGAGFAALTAKAPPAPRGDQP